MTQPKKFARRTREERGLLLEEAKALLTEQNMTAKEAARRLGISLNYVYRLIHAADIHLMFVTRDERAAIVRSRKLVQMAP